ncbi:uncharacterized protein C1orf112-like [Orussus abietinus]|uniref:uncharacterized protein C1orf112-like n=1 Tax=Orussus abietinus TaxID=222816 RepID=UPI0006268478|nr:uncharacterized protein C1orf112-like [Orussus abietinus]XP_012287381.1 uncharacterized protein C1orf112-like [Orussus abietinus]
MDGTNIESILPELKEALGDPDFGIRVEALQILILSLSPESGNSEDECLFPVGPENLEENFLAIALPAARQTYVKVIEGIKASFLEAVEGALEAVKEKLNLCESILDFCQKSVEYVKALGKISASKTYSLPVNILEILKSSFELCRDNRDSKVQSEALIAFFRKTWDLVKLFFIVINEIITFDCQVHKESELLIKVVDTIGEIASTINGINLNTLAEVWKEFGRLSLIHREDIKKLSPFCVTLHFKSIATNIASCLQSTCQVNNVEDVSGYQKTEKTIKCAGILLKLLNKLYSVYSEHLDEETVLIFIKSSSELYRCSPICLKSIGVNVHVVDAISKYIWNEVITFLNIITKNVLFEEAFCKNSEQLLIENSLGYHLLTIAVMKKLRKMPKGEYNRWMEGAKIINIAFNNINALDEELCAGRVRIFDCEDNVEEQKSITIYEATVIPICLLIYELPAEKFNAIELLLSKQLLSGKLWSSLLALDVWCFVGSVSSSELRFDHVRYLMKIYRKLRHLENSLEVLILVKLINQLYGLLSEGSELPLMRNFQDCDTEFWAPLAKVLPEVAKRNMWEPTSSDIAQSLSNFRQHPSVFNWNRLILDLKRIAVVGNCQEEKTIEVLSEIWKCIEETLEESEGAQMNLQSELIVALLNSTKPKNSTSQAFSTILTSMTMLTSYAPSNVKIKISHYLCDNFESFTDCEGKVADLIADLYYQLLSDPCPWVKQEALESFDRVSRVCKNETLIVKVSDVVARNPSIRDFVILYLSNKQFHGFTDNCRSGENYARLLAREFSSVDTRHQCRKIGGERLEKMPRLENFPKSNACLDVNERVKKVIADLEALLEKRNEISENSWAELRDKARKVIEAKRLDN